MATGIYKRGNVWWIRYTGIDSKQKRESSQSSDFKEASVLLADRIQSIAKGKEPEIKRIPNYTFPELADKYSIWMEGRQKSAKVKGYIIGQLLSFFGPLPLRRFSTLIVDQLQTELINKKYLDSSNNKVLNVLKHMFTKAVEWEMVEEGVLKKIRKVKPLKGENKRLRYLSKQDCQTLINSCEPHLKPIVITALNTGMRRGEILNLKWDNVDLRHGFILLDKTKNGDRREIPINDTLRITLQGLTRRLDNSLCLLW
jgi:integrase